MVGGKQLGRHSARSLGHSVHRQWRDGDDQYARRILREIFQLGGTAGSGTVQMTGGSLCVTSYEYVGDSGRGIFTQSGGTNSIGSSLYLGDNAGSNGTYNLNGGVLVISSLNTGLGTAAFNFNGGTLQASSSFSSSLPMTIGIGSSGTTLNTAGFAVTLSGSLSGPGGLTKSGGGTLTLSGSNTYGGGTAVMAAGTLQISGGGVLWRRQL